MIRKFRSAMRGVAGLVAGVALASPVFAGEHSRESVDDEIKMMDTNSDGYISEAEHAAGANKMFESMDVDRDGKVTANEMENAHKAAMVRKSSEHQASTAGRYDKGKTNEMSAAGKIKEIDTNNDGAITAAEHEAGSRMMFQKMDTDHDGRLSANELRAGHEKMMSGKGEKPKYQ